MGKIDLSRPLTWTLVSTFKEGSLDALIPELLPLKEVIEVNDWHNHRSTWDHTWDAVDNLREILTNPEMHEPLKYVHRLKIGNLTLFDLLVWATVLHDSAKPNCLVTKNGKTDFPQHEKIGSSSVIEILVRLGFSSDQIIWITKLIAIHGEAHSFFGKETSEFVNGYSKLAQKRADMLVPLLIHSYADSLHSFEQTSHPALYELRIRRYSEILQMVGRD